MTIPNPHRVNVSQLEEYIALNREIAGLMHVGLPLEVGLKTKAGKGLSRKIIERLEQGEPLLQILKEEDDLLPPAFRAAIEAGLASGRLGNAVETVSRSAQALVKLKSRLTIAAIYPSIILVFAIALSALVVPYLLEPVSALIQVKNASQLRPLSMVLWLFVENPGHWLIWFPIVVVVLLWLTGGLAALALRLPGLSRVLRYYRISTFADLAAGLVAQNVPLERAVLLAAEASGDQALSVDAKHVVAQLQAGETPPVALKELRSLPRFAVWMISTGAAQGTLPATLRHVADWASRKGNAGLDWFSLFAPAALTVIVGGLAVAAFAGISLGPVIVLLNNLSQAISR